MRTEIQQDENKQEIIQREAHQRSEGKRTNQILLEDNIAGFLCYLAGIITGILFLLLKPDSSFVRFFAWQSIMVSIFISVLGIIITIIDFIFAYIPIIGWIVGFFLTLIYSVGTLALWILLMITAYQGKEISIPLAGQIARHLTDNQ